MVYLEQPEDFVPTIEVVSCFLSCDGKMLLLHRQDHKPQGNTWGVPAGKVSRDESLIDAIQREMEEEISYVPANNEIRYFKKVFVRYPSMDFVYHMFTCELKALPKIIEINQEEHKDYVWVEPKDALKMDLIPGEDACIRMVIENR